MKKKILSLVTIAFICLITVFLNTKDAYAATGNVTVKPEKTSVMVGNEFSVTVDIDATSEIFLAEFSVNYNKALFDFVKSEPEAATDSPSGVVPYQIDPDKLSKKISVKLTFKAKAVGEGSFTVSGNQFMEFAGDEPTEIEMKYTGANVNVMAAGSDDATLNSLSVAGVNLDKPFKKWTLDYTCTVPNETTSVNISATSTQGGKIELGGAYNNLVVGNNEITIKSYAPNGKVMTYKINVVRQEPIPAPTEPSTEQPTEAPEETPAETTTEAENETGKELRVTIGEKEFMISAVYPEDEIPKDYEKEYIKINDVEIEAVKNSVMGLYLVHLTDSEENSYIYIYNVEKDSFEKYIDFKIGNNTYVYLDEAYALEIPANTTVGECKIKDKKVTVYISNDNKEFAYFYGVSTTGVRGWFCYDIKEGTIQRMAVIQSFDKNDNSDVENEAESLRSSNKELLKKLSREKTKILVICITFAIVVICMNVIIIVLAARKSGEKYSDKLELETAATMEDEDILTEEEEIHEDVLTEEVPEEALEKEEEVSEEALEEEENASIEEAPEETVSMDEVLEEEIEVSEDVITDEDIRNFNRDVRALDNSEQTAENHTDDNVIEIIQLEDDDDYFL